VAAGSFSARRRLNQWLRAVIRQNVN